jgi:hypothetical protein
MCAVANSFPNFKELSRDGGRADFFKTLRAFNKGCLSRQILVIAGNGSTVN